MCKTKTFLDVWGKHLGCVILVAIVLLFILALFSRYILNLRPDTFTASPLGTPILSDSTYLPDTYRCACDDLTPTPPQPVPPSVYDCTGTLTNTAWLTSTFGSVTWQRGPDATLAGLRCSIGPAVLLAHVEDISGQPLEGVTVVRYWPDAPELPPELQHPPYTRGVYGPTNANGDIGFGLGSGDFYLLPDAGASCIWIAGHGSDLLCGLGMLGFTDHQHLDSAWTAPAVKSAWGFTPGATVILTNVGQCKLVPVVWWRSDGEQ